MEGEKKKEIRRKKERRKIMTSLVAITSTSSHTTFVHTHFARTKYFLKIASSRQWKTKPRTLSNVIPHWPFHQTSPPLKFLTEIKWDHFQNGPNIFQNYRISLKFCIQLALMVLGFYCGSLIKKEIFIKNVDFNFKLSSHFWFYLC